MAPKGKSRGLHRVTIKDVAREAEVSFKTVSNVLNGTGSMRDETRRRVEETMVKLGYKANASARSLRTGKTGLIGLAVSPFDQPFASYLAGKVIDAARERQFGVVIDTYRNTVEDIVDDMNRLTADGWIAFATASLRDKALQISQSLPIVLAGDYLSHGTMDSVTMPNVESVYTVTKRLLETGSRRIGLLGAPEWLDGEHNRKDSIPERIDEIFTATEGSRELRTRGFLEAFRDVGVDVDWSIFFAAEPWTSISGSAAVERMTDIPQALICLNDAMAIGAMHELQQKGYKVPDDIQIIGFDNIEESRYSTPSLSTIDPLVDDYARTAVRMLIERIEGYDGPIRTYTTDFHFEERGSTLPNKF